MTAAWCYPKPRSRRTIRGRGIAIKRNDTRRTLLRPQRLPEEELGGRYIATRAQPEINGPPLPVHGFRAAGRIRGRSGKPRAVGTARRAVRGRPGGASLPPILNVRRR